MTAGLPDDWRADIYAICSTLMHCPANVPWQRWATFVSDMVGLVENGWLVRACKIGWSAAELWGCHRERPFDRLDCAGLCWVMNGDELIELTAEVAKIRTHTGTTHTFYRRPVAHRKTEHVLAWELPCR